MQPQISSELSASKEKTDTKRFLQAAAKDYLPCLQDFRLGTKKLTAMGFEPTLFRTST